MKSLVKSLPTSKFNMFKSILKPFSKLDDKGASLVEMCIVAPLFVTFIFGIFDIGRGLDNYATLTQVVHEGVRMGQGMEELNRTSFCAEIKLNAPISPCTQPGAEPFPSGADKKVMERVNQLVQAHINNRDLNIDALNIQAVTDLRPAPTPGVPNPTDDTFFVTLRAHYNGIFPVYRDIPMTIDATGPYLATVG